MWATVLPEMGIDLDACGTIKEKTGYKSRVANRRIVRPQDVEYLLQLSSYSNDVGRMLGDELDSNAGSLFLAFVLLCFPSHQSRILFRFCKLKGEQDKNV